MKLIGSAVDLASISGGGDGVNCEVGTSGVKCTGTPEQFFELLQKGLDKLQRAGGDLGIYIYEVTHKET